MQLDRRHALVAGMAGAGIVGAGLGVPGATTVAAAAPNGRDRASRAETIVPPAELGLVIGSEADQIVALQRAIDTAQAAGRPLSLPPGRYVTGPLRLKAGARLIGAHGLTRLVASDGGPLLSARAADDLVIADISLDGARATNDVVRLDDCARVAIEGLDIDAGDAPVNGLVMARVSGRVSACRIAGAGLAGLFCRDANGLVISGNTIERCANNGILVWREIAGEDGTQVIANRISGIAARDGGSGQNGNGINVFRADGVIVSGNVIVDCAYSAVRGNAASDILIANNRCAGIGEVALYAEFGFEGAVITGNIVDRAATGIAVTNFDRGGRLAVVQGNLVRNLFRREHEPVDKRGEGITVEADAAVTGNTIEEAPSAGIMVGWGPYLRDVAVNGNVIRRARTGILISDRAGGASCLVSGNLIAGVMEGAIRRMDHGRGVGPDLAREAAGAGGLVVTGNIAS
ncbi:MAG: TIGR03808 family TAT-translocated repetitive protein [Hyphomicrobiaceae bacterium]|nr:TIGR03808 family TAT-translocated repetitive protein [Hyphomicrobiaceae bacterium]